MKLLFDFFPVMLFFIAFKWKGIFVATAVAIGASMFQVIAHWFLHRRIEKMHLITFVMISVLGGATLIFRDPVFIQWKPTGIYWITALVFLGSQFFSKQTIIQKMMEANISLPDLIWRRLNLAWVMFFTIMGFVNIYVATHYDMNSWVNFKLFGGLGATFVFIILQSIYLAKHVEEVKEDTELST
tara:strand:+ start:687 stop:1241 length:555 start_codon:yes stop_codon:yes gene_type:complete